MPPPQTGASAHGPYQQVVEGDKLSDALSWWRNVLTNERALPFRHVRVTLDVNLGDEAGLVA